MRVILVSFFAIIFMLAFSFVLFIVSYVPAGLRLAAITATAQSCTPPQHVPANAGKLVVADLRQPGNGTLFPAAPREAWIDKTIAKLRSETDSTRDLVVFAHGFRTSVMGASCAGEVLRTELAGLPAYALTDGPDIFVFGWPGEFWPWQFPAARDNAARAGLYLSGVLQGLTGRRVILVAHSLGAEVVMTSAADLPEHDRTPPLAGMLLIEGAIPAVSIRNWRSTFTETHPRADLENLIHHNAQSPPYVETSVGGGRFVPAAAKAAHLVVTTAGADIPLADAFALNERFLPSDRNGPIIPADRAGNQIEALAIGTPFPSGKIHRHFEEVLLLPDLQKDFAPVGQFRPHLPPVTAPVTSLFDDRPTDPSQVLSSDDWDFEFQVEHLSYHEIRLGGQWSRLLYDWHGVMNDEIMRHRILSESWAFFTGQAN
jgi:pimeloyl-ACP methyl ester carboxylesterase